METNALKEILELGTEELINAAIENNEGVIASNGALSLETGLRTGRSPNDRFIVDEDSTSALLTGAKLINLLMQKSSIVFGIRLRHI